MMTASSVVVESVAALPVFENIFLFFRAPRLKTADQRMGRWLSGPEDLGSILSTYVVSHSHLSVQCQEILHALLTSKGTKPHTVHRHTCKQKQLYT